MMCLPRPFGVSKATGAPEPVLYGQEDCDIEQFSSVGEAVLKPLPVPSPAEVKQHLAMLQDYTKQAEAQLARCKGGSRMRSAVDKVPPPAFHGEAEGRRDKNA